MAVVALIMAGGKGTRMGSSVEKPLVSIDGKTMLERVVEALKAAAGIEEIFVATSPNALRAEELALSLGLKVIRTRGRDYVSDAQQAIRTLVPRVVLVMSADLPLISSTSIDDIIDHYYECGKPSLKVVTSTNGNNYDAKDGSRGTEQRERVRPAGINVIDSRHIDELVIDEAELLVNSEEVAVNINTLEDLEKISSKKSMRHHDEMADRKSNGNAPR